MTEQTPLYIDDDGDELALLSDSLLRVTNYGDTGADRASVRIPQRVAHAIRTALVVTDDYTIVAFPKSARLADVAPLLARCDREDAHPGDLGAYLYTREIRHLLGQPVLCGNVPENLGGARCSLEEHDTGWDAGWHVDEKKRLQWRYSADEDGELDVRGWTPDDARPDDIATPLLVTMLDDYRVPVDLDAAGVKKFVKDSGLEPTAPDGLWEAAQAVRRSQPGARRPLMTEDQIYTERKAAEITAALDKAGAPDFLDVENARDVLSGCGVGIVATGQAWIQAVKERQARGSQS